MSRSNELIDQQPPDKGKSIVVREDETEENNVGKVVEIAAEVPIPWRTSRRLQEATFKSLQERETGLKPNNTLTVKKEKETTSPVSTSTRSLRRQHSPAEAVAGAEQKEVCERRKAPAPPPLNTNSGRKRRRKVHFGNPLFIHIEEQRQNSSASSATSAGNKLLLVKKSPHTGQISTPSQSRNVAVQQKQPLSCFDFLCNHVGPRGWRCYRVCLEGGAFCSNHMNRATSLASISVCT